jgi:hypothetical protein
MEWNQLDVRYALMIEYWNKLIEAAIQQLLLSNGFANKHICMENIGKSNKGMVSSEQTVPRYYKQDS